MKLYLSILFSMLMIFSCASVMGQSEEEIIHQSKKPFIVVFDDAEEVGENSTKRTIPGLYRAKLRGKGYELAFPGELLSYRGKHGIVEFLGGNNFDHKAIFVVDGELIVASINSTAKNKKSFINVNDVLVDFVSNQKIKIGKIESLNDVSAYSVRDFNGLRHVLVSVKQENMFGSGFTFFFSDTGDHKRPKTVSEPMIIDYTYRESSKLNRIVNNRNDKVLLFSENMVQSQLNANVDNPLFKDWVTRIKQELSYMKKKKNLHFSDIRSPLINLSNNALPHMNYDVFSTVMRSGVIDIKNTVNPYTYEEVIKICYGNNEQEIPGKIGKMGKTANSRNKVFYDSNQHGLNVFFITEKADFYHVDANGVHFISNLGDDAAKVKNFHFTTIKTVGKKKDLFHHVWSMDIGSRKGQTGVVSIAESKQGSFIKFKKDKLLPYYLDESSLKYRLLPKKIRHLDDYEFGKLDGVANFDILSPRKKTATAYSNQLDLKLPFLDLHKTAENKRLLYSYIEPVKKIRFRKNLEYIEYKELKEIPNPSGLFANENSKIVSGEILGLKKNDIHTIPLLDKNVLVFPMNAQEKMGLAVTHNVYAIDNDFNKGEDGFRLIVDFSKSEKASMGFKQTNADLLDTLHEIEVKESFKRLIFAKQFVSQSQTDPNKKILSLVMSFKADAGARKSKAYIHVQNIEIESETTDKGIVIKTKAKSDYTEDVYITNGRLSSYIVYEESNKDFCLVRTPELATNSRDFIASPLHEPTVKIYPGRNKGHKLNDAIVKENLSFVWERALTELVGSWKRKIPTPTEENMQFLFGDEELSKLTEAELKANNSLFSQLDKFAKGKDSSKHLVLVFNDAAEKDEMKKIIGRKFVNAKYDEPFRYSYSDDLYYVDSAKSVEEITTNYNAMAKTTRDLFVFADMEELNSVGDNGKIERDTQTSELGDVWNYKSGRKKIAPNLLYYLLTEGQQVELDQIEMKTAPRHRTLVFSTIDEYLSATEDISDAFEAGLSKNVEVNFDYLETPWRLEAAKKEISQEFQPRAKKASEVPIRSVDKKIYKDVDKLLTEMVENFKKVQNGEASPESLHQFYIVDKELKNTVFELLYGWYYTNSKDTAFLDADWSHRNEKLKLFSLPKHNGGREEISYALKNIYSSFAAMSKEVEAGGIPFLVGDIADVASAGRVNYDIVDGETRVIESTTKLHTLSDYQLARGGEDDVNMNVDVDSRKTPHLLWWLANEGKKTSTRKFDEGIKSEIPMLLIGTEDEVKALNNQISFESRFGLDTHFEKRSLNAPSKDVLRKVLDEYFDSRSFKKLGYQFSMPSTDLETAKEVFIDYFLKKTESLSRNNKKNLVLQFSRSLDELGRKLAEDVTLRRSKVVTDRVLEDVFTKVFDMPLNSKYLTNTDPLMMILENQSSKFIDSLGQQGPRHPGYEGPWDLKNVFAKGLTAQVTSSKNGLKIPSSIVTYGTTSTGKTFLWEKLFEVLKLNEYDFGEPHDKKDIRAMVVDLNKIIDDIDGNTKASNSDGEADLDAVIEGTRLQPINGEQIPLSQLKLHIHNLLAKPNGHRSYILFDDVHKANTSRIKKEVIGFLKTLFEAENGIYKFKSPIDGSLREIPVRNLTIGMTLNPAQESLRKQMKEPELWDDITVMADTLSDDNFKLEESFFHRWNKLLNLSQFSAEAKAPSLISTLRSDVLKGDFTRNSGLVIPLPSTIESIVNGFPDANAREFLPNASSELSSKGQVSHNVAINPITKKQYTPLKILVPRRLISEDLETVGKGGGTEFAATGSSKEQIVQFIDQNIAVVPVTPESVEARVLFMKFIANNFRTFVYTTLIDQVSKNSNLMGNSQMKNAYVHPLFLALTDHLKDMSNMPLERIMINPVEFGVRSNAQRENLKSSILKFADKDSSINYNQVTKNFVSEELFVNELMQERKRLDVVRENTVNLQKNLVKNVLSDFIRVDSVDRLPNVKTWLSGLDVNSASLPKGFETDFVNELRGYLSSFQAQMVSKDVVENQSLSYSLPEQYDIFRLFFYSLDKSIVAMPWERIAMFLISMNNEISDDIHSVQELGLQHFIFDSKISPFKTETFDRIKQVVEGSKAYSTYIERLGERKNKFGDEFKTNCDRFFRISNK